MIDLFTGQVHRIEKGKPSFYLDSPDYASGLLAESINLYILTTGYLVKAYGSNQF